MKVISGKYKGTNLNGYNLNGTRPTMDRVKESLFAMLQFDIEEKIILDLFSGSGNLGIESLSMKAKKVYFVDYNKKSIDCIKENLNKLRISKEEYEIINKDFEKALKQFYEEKIKFDIIFLDPPYKTDYIERAIELIVENNLLNHEGFIVCESDNLEKIPKYDFLKEIKSKKYGDKHIVILKK